MSTSSGGDNSNFKKWKIKLESEWDKANGRCKFCAKEGPTPTLNRSEKQFYKNNGRTSITINKTQILLVVLVITAGVVTLVVSLLARS